MGILSSCITILFGKIICKTFTNCYQQTLTQHTGFGICLDIDSKREGTVPVQYGPMSRGEGQGWGTCTVRPNASWVMVTGPPRIQNDRQT